MGKRRSRRKKWRGFKKIKLSTNAKMWIVLLSAILPMLTIAWIAEIDILVRVAFGFALTSPIFLLRYQFPNLFGISKGLYKAFIYAYIILWWVIVLLPWAKIRWLLAVVYFFVCGIYLVYKIPEIKRESEFDCDIVILCIVEILMFVSTFGILHTTEINTLGWIITAILAIVPTLIVSYYIWQENTKIYKKVLYSIVAVVFVFIYSWALTAGLNSVLDFSKPAEYKTMVKEKDYSRGRGKTTYSFTAYINGKLIEFDVDRDIYEKYNEGSDITVNIHKGALGLTYYTMDE